MLLLHSSLRRGLRRQDTPVHIGGDALIYLNTRWGCLMHLGSPRCHKAVVVGANVVPRTGSRAELIGTPWQ